MTSKLVITIPIKEGDEEWARNEALVSLEVMFKSIIDTLKYKAVQVALLRDGDRSGGNLLLPRLEGRLGSHLQGRKASLIEVLKRE